MAKDKVERPSDELGMSKSVECDTVPLQCSDILVCAKGSACGL